MDRSDQKTTVTFFREEREEDAFREVFTSMGYEPHFAPVLVTEYPELPPWPQQLHDAVVVTSRRSLLALSRSPIHLENLRHRIGSVPWFAVGETTAKAIQRLGFRVIPDRPGTSRLLAEPIMASGARRVLFLTGDPHRTDLEDVLEEHGIAVTEYVLYRTEPAAPSEKPTPGGWAVFFSPRGVAAAIDHVPDDVRIAAIGPVTAEALKRYGRTADAIAERPEAESLMHAIEHSPIPSKT